MSIDRHTVGRRERNKQQKLDRITAAARELFAERCADNVTTQQIADRADIGAGTLFLYAKTKGELLLLVQNNAYAAALERGRAAADQLSDPLEAMLAVIAPVVQCNRSQVHNGRLYLRELVFGDPTEPRHGEALAIVAETETALAGILTRHASVDPQRAAVLARVVTALTFLTMASAENLQASLDEVVQEIRDQLIVVLPS